MKNHWKTSYKIIIRLNYILDIFFVGYYDNSVEYLSAN